MRIFNSSPACGTCAPCAGWRQATPNTTIPFKNGIPVFYYGCSDRYSIDPIKVSFRMLPLCPQAPEIRSLRPGRYTHSKIPHAIHASLTAHFNSNGSMKGIQEVILLWGCWYCARRCFLDRDFCTFPNISLINTHQLMHLFLTTIVFGVS